MYVINGSVPHCAAVLTVPQCVPISSLSADHICSQLQKPPPPSRLQTGSLSQSGGLFWKSSLVILRSLCVSYLPAFFKNLSPPPWSTPLSCPLFSICFLTSYLPSFLQAYPSPLAELTVCLSNCSQVMEARGCHSTIWCLLIHFSLKGSHMTEMLHIIFIVLLHKKSAPVFTLCLLVFLRSQPPLLRRVAHGAHMLCSSSLCVRLHVCECAKCR